jgi:Domain of unknown function (DUF397)
MGQTRSYQGLTWRKSSRSVGDGECVEVAPSGDAMIVRDSKNPDAPAIRFSSVEWKEFLDGAKRGDFDKLDSSPPEVAGLKLRRQFGNENARDFFRGLLADATESDDIQRRYIKLFQFARSTIREIVIALLVGSLIFGGGIAAAVTIAGIHIAVAISIGAGGSATFILTAVIRSRRYLKAVLNAFSRATDHASESAPQTSEAEKHRAAA